MKNFFKILSSNIIAQVLIIISTPLIARVFGPQAFGVYGILLSLISILGSIASLQYDTAILNATSKDESRLLYHISLMSLVMISCLIFLLVFSFYPYFNTLNNLNIGRFYCAVIIAFGIVSERFMLSTNNLSIKMGNINHAAIAKVASSSLSQLYKLMFGVFGFLSGGYLIFSKNVSDLLTSIWLLLKNKNNILPITPSTKKYFNVIQKYKRYPIYNTWSSLLYNGNIMIPALVLGCFFDTVTIGFFVFARAVVNLPVNIMTKSFVQLFNVNLSEIKRDDKRLSLVINETILILLKISLIPFLLLFAYGSEIFILVFGKKWLISGELVEIMGIMIFFNFITSSLQPVFNIFDKQHLNVFFSILLFLITLFSLVLGGLYADIKVTVYFFTFGNSVVRFFMFITIMGISRCNYLDLFRRVKTLLFASILILFTTQLCELFLDNKGLNILTMVLILIVSSIYYILSLKQSLKIEFEGKIK